MDKIWKDKKKVFIDLNVVEVVDWFFFFCCIDCIGFIKLKII